MDAQRSCKRHKNNCNARHNKLRKLRGNAGLSGRDHALGKHKRRTKSKRRGQCATKATQTTRVVEEQQLAFPQSSKICGTEDPILTKHSQSSSTKLARVVRASVAEVEEEEELGTGGQGTNQVSSPVTPIELQGKHLDEHMDEALILDAHKLPMQ